MAAGRWIWQNDDNWRDRQGRQAVSESGHPAETRFASLTSLTWQPPIELPMQQYVLTHGMGF
jgi:hypothetical protein